MCRFVVCWALAVVVIAVNTPPTTPGRKTEKEPLVSEDTTTAVELSGPPETETPVTGTG